MPLCQVGYAQVCGLAIRTLQRYTKWARDKEGPSRRGTPLGYQTRKTAAARVWLLKYASLHDMMPNSSTKGRTTVSPISACRLGVGGGERRGGGGGGKEAILW